MPWGLGAKSAANSTFPVSTLSRLQFSQVQPPCMAVETMPFGNAAAGRGSMAQSTMVCVPPPLPPVTPTRSSSTSGRLHRKSSARMEFQVCSPIMLCMRISAWVLKNPQLSRPSNSGRCFLKPCASSRVSWTLSAYPIMSKMKVTHPMRANCAQRASLGNLPDRSKRSAPSASSRRKFRSSPPLT